MEQIGVEKMSTMQSDHDPSTQMIPGPESEKTGAPKCQLLFIKTKGKSVSESLLLREKRCLKKNLWLISLSFLLFFTAYKSLARLQSSLHVDEGMGMINQGVIYVALVLSSMFLPDLVISKLGHKWTIPVSMAGYVLWFAANGYAIWASMIPASILVGLSAAPLWTAKCSYFTLAAEHYASISGEPRRVVMARCFGIFFFMFQLCGVVGGVVTATTLNERDNSTHKPDREAMATYCGINDCPDSNLNQTALTKPSTTVVWTMVGVLIGLAVAAIALVAVFVDNLPHELVAKVKKDKPLKMIMSTLKHFRHPTQLLLVPITLYSGIEQVMYSGDFNKAFVSCPYGTWTVGLVMISFSLTNALTSLTGGMLVKHVGRLPIFTYAMLTDVTILTTLHLWTPSPEQMYVVFILAAMWGSADGIWQTQINGLYGDLFSTESEAAFSNYRLCESMGFAVSSYLSSFLCMHVKIYITLTCLAIGMACYYITEYIVYTQERAVVNLKTKENDENEQL